MTDVTLQNAATTDIPAIRALAVRIWNQHYAPIISREQIEYMLEEMYSEQSLLRQMSERGHTFLFVVTGEWRCGFISWNEEDERTVFINKFYIDQEIASKGVGTAAFSKLRQVTGAECFRLTVNRQNFKAINFYFKNGFTIERVADFDIGNGFVMNDFVMVWKRDPASKEIRG